MLGLLSCAGTLQQEQATGTQQSIADLSRHSDAPVVFSSIFAQFNSTLQVPRQQQRDVNDYRMHTDPSIVNHDLTCLHTLTTYCNVASGPDGHFNVPKSGCMSPTAVNFDILAMVHDAAVCIFETRKFTYLQRGCTLSEAMNYDSRATVSDASCIFKSSSSAVRMNLRRERLESKNVLAPIETGKQMIPLMTPQRRGSADSRAYGCTDSLAANFDRLADENDGSCVLSPGGCNLHGVIGLPPSFGSIPSLSCDPSSKSGCTKRWATNFDDSALLDDGSCVAWREGCVDSHASNFELKASLQSRRTSMRCAYIISGCTESAALNWNPTATQNDGTCRYAVQQSGAPANTPVIPRSSECLTRADCRCTNVQVTSSSSLTQEVGKCLSTECSNQNAAAHSRMSHACALQSVPPTPRGGCLNMSALNLDDAARYDDGICRFARRGGATSKLLPRRAAGEWRSRALSSCNSGLSTLGQLAGGSVICGCTQTRATNHMPEAVIDDGSCIGVCARLVCEGCLVTHPSDSSHFPARLTVLGCTDSLALNYDVSATVQSRCLYPQLGCTVPSADNYDSLATVDATPSMCTFLARGCTDSSALNFDPSAEVDDGLCRYARVEPDPAGLFDQRTVFVVAVSGLLWADVGIHSQTTTVRD